MTEKRSFKIVNIVAVGKLKTKNNINLEKLAERLDGEYDSLIFPGLTLRLRNPRSSLLLFSTGKMVCTGTSSIVELEVALREFRKIIVAAMEGEAL